MAGFGFIHLPRARIEYMICDAEATGTALSRSAKISYWNALLIINTILQAFCHDMELSWIRESPAGTNCLFYRGSFLLNTLIPSCIEKYANRIFLKSYYAKFTGERLLSVNCFWNLKCEPKTINKLVNFIKGIFIVISFYRNVHILNQK